MRGRRVALLLTGLWPLLAIDDVPTSETNVTAEANSEEIQLPPSLTEAFERPLNILSISKPSNVVMIDPIIHAGDLLEGYVEIDDRIQHQHVALHEAGPTETQEAAKEETEPISDDDERPTEASEASSQDEPETNEEADASAQVLVAADDSDAAELHDVEIVQEPDSATDTTTDEETQKVESDEPQDDIIAESQAPLPMDEDEDEDGTDRLLVDYASKSAGAIILEKGPAMKGTSNLLNGDNDKYAIAPCAEKKFVVINLSEDILVKQVKLANYERYSSHLKDFQIMGSQTMGDWVDLGTYTAEPGNGEQAFDLKEPAWARYLKFRFLTHHGSEHYCTYSQIKVHGSTMLQGFHEQWDSQEDLEEEGDGGEDDAVTAETREKVQAPLEVDREQTDNTTSKEASALSGSEDSVSDTLNEEDETTKEAGDCAVDSTEAETVAASDADSVGAPTPGTTEADQVIDTAGNYAEPKSSSDESLSKDEDAKDETSIATEPPADQGSLKEDEKPTLACASIGISSHDAVNAECKGSTEQLNTSSIKPVDKSLKAVVASVVKEMVAAEALITVNDARSVSDEVRDIQDKLRTTIMSPGLGRIVSREIEKVGTGSATETAEPISAEQPEAAEAAEDTNQDKSESGIPKRNETSTETVEEHEMGVTLPEGSPKAIEDDNDSAAAASKHRSQVKTTSSEEVEPAEETRQSDLDPALASVVARFPSAACMEGLDYHEFKAKIVAARKERANAQGSHQGHPGKNEPIFKLLTDEIKGLQTSQSAQDQYMKALMECYQQVMLEMAETLNHVETRQDKRLLDLERAMEAAQSDFFMKVLADVAGVVSSFNMGTRLLCKATGKSLETLVSSGLVNDTTPALLVLGACLLGMLVLGYCICSFRYREQALSRKKTKSNADEDAKNRKDAKRVSNKEACPFAIVEMATPAQAIQASVVPDVVHSENESDNSDPSTTLPVIALAPRPIKRPNVQNDEPNLVSLE